MKKTGVKGAIKSRLLTAIDRLCANRWGVVNAEREGKTRLIEIEYALKAEALRLEGEAAIERLKVSPEFGQRVLDGLFADQIRKQTNNDAVIVEAIEELKHLPPPDHDAPKNPSDDLDADWLNMFSSHTEKASSDRVRKLWGQVLAGEVRKPGSFSLTTLRFISELDQEIATLFQEVMLTRISDDFIARPEPLMGKQLLDLTFLEEVGLLQEVNGQLSIPKKPHTDGFVYYSGESSWRVNSFALKIKPASPADVQIPLIKITRLGRELLSILPPTDYRRGLSIIARSLKVNEVHLHRIDAVHADGTADSHPVEMIPD